MGSTHVTIEPGVQLDARDLAAIEELSHHRVPPQQLNPVGDLDSQGTHTNWRVNSVVNLGLNEATQS